MAILETNTILRFNNKVHEVLQIIYVANKKDQGFCAYGCVKLSTAKLDT